MIGQSLGLLPFQNMSHIVPPTGAGWRGRPPTVTQRYVAPTRVYMPPTHAFVAQPAYTQPAPIWQRGNNADAMARHRQALKEMEERRRLAMMTARLAAQQNTIQAQSAAAAAQAQLVAAQQAAAATAAAAGAPPPAPVAPLPPLNPIVAQSPMPAPQASVSPSTETDVSPQQDAAADDAAANAVPPEHSHKKLFIGLALLGAGVGGYVLYKKHKKGGSAPRHRSAE